MNFDSQFLFFFSAIGVFNSTLLAIYFFFYAKPKHISNYFLGTLLTVLSIRIWKSIFYYFNRELSKIYLQIGLSACFLIGPSLFFYLKSILNPSSKKIDHSWKYHFLFLFIIILAIGYSYPYEDYPDLWRFYFVKVIYYQWLGYILASGFLLRKVIKKMFTKHNKLNSAEIWITSVYFGNLIIWIAYKTVSYTSYIVGALSFSFVFYLLLLILFFRKKKYAILFREPSKYADKKIEEAEAKRLFEVLEETMKSKKLYKNPNLKLPDLAKQIHIQTHLLSQFINDNLNKSFSLFVNEYRIHEAKILLSNKDKFTIESIGYECGFNSKSTFYSTFKKLTGMTPTQYKSAQS
ncbi:AraC family transcriptional regulator [Aquimarina sp. AU119]|uniref:helix-turn-helix domain-containing protein n=1 Tax=Aquimarina sp. AU119 TaxID=2108528 RepID=UPI000D688FF7|nr:helix-turn-helix transcriptional regulator [Aquimarina sp. AU119]